MSGTDKFRNKIDEVSGQAKETVGRMSGDRSLEARGRRKRMGANLKQAAEKVKDAFRGKPRQPPRQRRV